MTSLKYLISYTSYINEQELGIDPMAAVPPPKEKEYNYVFIVDGEKGDYKYPDGSSSKNFSTYKISQSELNEWLDKNIISKKDEEISDSVLNVRKESIKNYIIGLNDSISPDSKRYVESFKNASKASQIGLKVQDTEITFSPRDNIPMTSVLDVTFVILSKK